MALFDIERLEPSGLDRVLFQVIFGISMDSHCTKSKIFNDQHS